MEHQPHNWRSSFMTRAQEWTERADQLGTLADKAVDLSYMRDRCASAASEWEALAVELHVIECDPLYRQIHDRP